MWKGKDADPAFPQDLPNRPFRIDAPPVNLPLSVATRDLVHKFYQNQEQINGGRNDRFVARRDAGALAMGYYDGSALPMWKWAKDYMLADNFFMGAFGGSYLNHFWLVCACTPDDRDAPAELRAQIDERGWLEDEARLAGVRVDRPADLRAGRRRDARRLFGEHDAAALAAVARAAGEGRRSARRPIRRSTRCRRRR